MSKRTGPISIALLCLLSPLALAETTAGGVLSKVEKASNRNGYLVASSVVSDEHAKKIRRNMASESLRPLSTRDTVSVTEVSNDEPLADNQTSPGLAHNSHGAVSSQAAPGTRDPATADSKDGKSDSHAGHDASANAGHEKGAHQAPAGVPSDKALKWLQNGNKRYITRNVRKDGNSQKDRDRQTKGQHPHAIVLSCADSRVPPETIFDQALGEIFVVRTAGESLDSSVIASLEYAVEHLGPRLLVVMGHTSCGAVKAALETPADKSAGSPSLDKLVSDIRPRLPSGTSLSAGLEVESTSNAKGVAADLLKRSEIIRSRVEKGDLEIRPALYYIDSGKVKFD